MIEKNTIKRENTFKIHKRSQLLNHRSFVTKHSFLKEEETLYSTRSGPTAVMESLKPPDPLNWTGNVDCEWQTFKQQFIYKPLARIPSQTRRK